MSEQAFVIAWCRKCAGRRANIATYRSQKWTRNILRQINEIHKLWNVLKTEKSTKSHKYTGRTSAKLSVRRCILRTVLTLHSGLHESHDFVNKLLEALVPVEIEQVIGRIIQRMGEAKGSFCLTTTKVQSFSCQRTPLTELKTETFSAAEPLITPVTLPCRPYLPHISFQDKLNPSESWLYGVLGIPRNVFSNRAFAMDATQAQWFVLR